MNSLAELASTQKEHGINNPYIGFQVYDAFQCYPVFPASSPVARCACLRLAPNATDHGFASNEESAVEPSRITFYSSVAISIASLLDAALN